MPNIQQGYIAVCVAAFLIWHCQPATAGPNPLLEKGYVQNEKGEKCAFKQTLKNQKYFTDVVPGEIGIIEFDDPTCMSDTGMGLDVNKMMINNLISRWYSHDDAKFMSHPTELFAGSSLQVRGSCMQSTTYSNVGVTIDYIVQNNSIVRVIHGSSIQGCLS